MNRHGVVVPREDGVKARCLGPGSCKECALDMADAGDEAVVQWIAKEFGRRWSQPNSELPALIKWVAICVAMQLNAYDLIEAGPRPVTVSVPMVDAPRELKLMAALNHLCDHFRDATPAELGRATAWLANKYAPLIQESQE